MLVVGCGNSNLCEDMAECHKGPIEGIDISETVIKEMNERHEQRKQKTKDL